MSDLVRIEEHSGVGLLTLNRAEKRNALDLSLRSAFADAMRTLTMSQDVRVIVVTGGDKVFAAGADLNLLVDKGSQEVADIDLPQYWAPLANCPKPVVAAVNGFALGAGSELAMMCDIIVADKTARFGQPEARVGIMPGAGGTQRLLRAVGKPVANLLLMSGEMLKGERAFQLGLVSELTEAESALPRAMELAAAISKMPPKALRAIKRCVLGGADLPLDAALAMEYREFLCLFDTADQSEGMRAFLEKRKPEFKGE